MKQRISLFFLTVSVVLMMGHNLIPHCHHGHGMDEYGTALESSDASCFKHDNPLGYVFSIVAHNHAGMTYIEHLHGDVSIEKKTNTKPEVKVQTFDVLFGIALDGVKNWTFPPPEIYLFDVYNIRGLRAPPFFT